MSEADSRGQGRLAELLAGDGREGAEREALARLMWLLLALPPPPDPIGLYPRYRELHAAFSGAARGGDGEALEEAFLELYCHLHGHQAPYTATERALVDSSGGYWCHAGGLSPILKAPRWLTRESVSADLGAGNGLQLLLLQKIAPHARTVQIEVSSRMVEAGRALQRWLGIEEGRVEWRCQDVRQVEVRGFDLLYLYRPLRPEGEGRGFYERVGRDLDATDRPVVIFSIADCLGPFLPVRFQRFYYDGHLACYRGEPATGHDGG